MTVVNLNTKSELGQISRRFTELFFLSLIKIESIEITMDNNTIDIEIDP